MRKRFCQLPSLSLSSSSFVVRRTAVAALSVLFLTWTGSRRMNVVVEGAVTPADGIPQELSACFTIEPDFEPPSVEEERQFLSCFLVAYNNAMDGMGYTLEELRILSDFEVAMFVAQSSNNNPNVTTAVSANNNNNATEEEEEAPSTSAPSGVPSSIPSWVTVSKWGSDGGDEGADSDGEEAAEAEGGGGDIGGAGKSNKVPTASTATTTTTPTATATDSPTSAPLPELGFECPPGHTGLVPAEECTKYLNCVDGRLVGSAGVCPLGLLFDEAQVLCVDAHEVQCHNNNNNNNSPSSSTSTSTSTTTPPSSSSSSLLTGLILVHAETNQDIGPLKDGDVLDVTTLGARLNIRAQTSESVTAVRFDLDSNHAMLDETTTDQEAPFSMGDDNQGNYKDILSLVQVGSHRITATPFSSSSSVWGAAYSINIQVIGFGISGFTLIDTTQQSAGGGGGGGLLPLWDAQVVNLAELGGGSFSSSSSSFLTIQAETVGPVDTVHMSCNNPLVHTVHDSPPFVLTAKTVTENGETTLTPLAELQNPGDYTISATPWIQGTQGVVASITIRVVNLNIRQRQLQDTLEVQEDVAIVVDDEGGGGSGSGGSGGASSSSSLLVGDDGGESLGKKKKKSKTGVGGKGFCAKCIEEVMPTDDCPGCLTRRNLLPQFDLSHYSNLLLRKKNVMVQQKDKNQRRLLEEENKEFMPHLFSTCLKDAHEKFGYFAAYGGLNASHVQIGSCTNDT